MKTFFSILFKLTLTAFAFFAIVCCALSGNMILALLIAVLFCIVSNDLE